MDAMGIHGSSLLRPFFHRLSGAAFCEIMPSHRRLNITEATNVSVNPGAPNQKATVRSWSAQLLTIEDFRGRLILLIEPLRADGLPSGEAGVLLLGADLPAPNPDQPAFRRFRTYSQVPPPPGMITANWHYPGTGWPPAKSTAAG
jgi:hypothetical protein